MTAPDQQASSSSELINRLVTAVFLIPLLYLIFRGGWPAGVIVLVAGAIMAWELLTIANIKIFSVKGVVCVFALIGPAILALVRPELSQHYGLFIMAAAMLVLLQIGQSWVMRGLSIALSLCLFSIIGILALDGGNLWIVFAVVVIIAADSMAYFGGRFLGGPKLARFISPSKTWSGAMCGVSAGALAGSAMGMAFGFDPIISGVLGLFMADFSIGGDLLESWFKRHYQVKDSGQILPGHGGFLDRFDGYVLALPFLYLVLNLGVV